MESTGSTTSKNEKRENAIPKDHHRYLQSIAEQGLGEKQNRKKLQTLFDRYLKPQQNESRTLDIQKEWGRQFKEGLANVPKRDLPDETNFITDVIIYYLYYDIITDRQKYPKSVPYVDLPIEMIEFLIKKVQKIFEEERSLV